jgi:hypothetical protein
MQEYKSATDSAEELFQKFVELYQIPYYNSKDYATKREKQFLWATYNIQKRTKSKKLFTKPILKLYKEYSFSQSNVNNYSKALHTKRLVNRESGEIHLIDEMENFDPTKGVMVMTDIIYQPSE